MPAIFKPNLIIQKKTLKYYMVFGISFKLVFSLNLYFLNAVNMAFSFYPVIKLRSKRGKKPNLPKIESKIKSFNKIHPFDTSTKLSASKLRASS